MPRHHRTWLRRVLEFRFLFVVNMIVLIFLAWSFGREFLRNREIQRDIASLQAEADALQARNLEITRLHSTLQTESSIEREARLKLGLKKPGEQVVVIQPGTQTTQDGDGDASSDPFGILSGEAEMRVVANPVKWWYYFFHREAYRELVNYAR
jgi:cell division protein FtsB